MQLYKLIILLLGLHTIYSAPSKKNPSPLEWYAIWKVKAPIPGSTILDKAERHGILRGYKPPIAEDPLATGINSYVKNLVQNDYNLNYN
jgi:hypothetical protein